MNKFLSANKKHIFISIIFLSVLLAAVFIICYEKTPDKEREIKAGGVIFVIPKFLPECIQTGNEIKGSLIFGSIEERCACKEQFLEISWSDKDILPDEILKSSISQNLSEKTKNSGAGQELIINDIIVTTEKACGSKVSENLRIIKIYDKKRKKYFAVSAIIDRIITENQLIQIIKKIKDPFLFSTKG